MINLFDKVIDCKSPGTGEVALIIVDVHDPMWPVIEAVVKWYNRTLSTVKADKLIERDGYLEMIK